MLFLLCNIVVELLLHFRFHRDVFLRGNMYLCIDTWMVFLIFLLKMKETLAFRAVWVGMQLL